MKDAIRMVGHLLDGRATTRTWARDKDGNPIDVLSKEACFFCLEGAIERVADVLYIIESDIKWEICKKLNVYKLAHNWDDATDSGRREIINKLKEYK